MGDLLAVLAAHANETFAWCVLPNHYHALVEAADIKRLVYHLGRLHGRTSHAWNAEECTRGRKVFFRAVERAMRSDRHYWATLNYVHHNPVRHGYVDALDGLAVEQRSGIPGPDRRERGEACLAGYRIHEYGKNWDDPEM